MNIEHLLATAPEHIRAWLAHPSLDRDRVGWRYDVASCPVAAWLDFERAGGGPVVDAETIKVGRQQIATPPLLSLFIDLIDGGYASTNLHIKLVGNDLVSVSVPAQVTADEALAALAEAERRAAQHQLPARAESLWCCIDGCDRRAWSPPLHGFLAPNEEGPYWREECMEFAGPVCAWHWEFVVAPPPGWWSVESQRKAVYAGA